ncbi:hypothetical protein C6P40_001559 [Pichia californica]|uniref:Pyrimidine 5'-nucleotidase n=1 Tax=Pichia californica TaxID=460514 RepID=A0A9P6WJ96_9ASCO|nr:hypothetical protein C6P42_001630 [[Candida] californica]KAG0687971.1 hypothetical protein C6P40_001559 [[Candida] californica]
MASDNIHSTPLSTCDSSAQLNLLSDDDIKEREILILNKNSQSNLSLLLSNNLYSELNYLKSNLPPVNLTYSNIKINPPPILKNDEKIFFFDIDNCLYKRSTKIHDLMQIYIHKYFKSHLHLNDNEAHQLHMFYYKQYGLALEGLVRLHKVNAMDYNNLVDDALPLDKILLPNPLLRNLLLKLKKSGKIKRLWLFTNAYKNHALRVIHLLGLGDLFDGLTYCNYNNFPLICKPMEKSFQIAFNESGSLNNSNIYFIDDSEINVKAARKFNWGKIIHYVELDSDLPNDLNTYPALDIHIIRSILDIEKVCPELF